MDLLWIVGDRGWPTDAGVRMGRPWGVVEEGIGRARGEGELTHGVLGDILVVAAAVML